MNFGTHTLDLLSQNNSEVVALSNTTNNALISFYDNTSNYVIGTSNRTFTINNRTGYTCVGIGTVPNISSNANLIVNGTIMTSNITTYNTDSNINFNNNTHDTVDVHEIDFFCNPFKNTDIKKLDGIINDDTKIKSLIDFNVNCINIYFSLNYEINRQRLFNKLVEHDYICKYKPESYSGIKLIYKYGLNNIKNGICSCSDKCTCTNITFLIFQSGNIIVTGFKNTKEIDNILNNFIEYLSLLKENIQKKNTE